LQALLIGGTASGGDHRDNLVIVVCEDPMRAALGAAAPLRLLLGLEFDLGHFSIDLLAIRVKRLNQEHDLTSRITQLSAAHPLLSGQMWLKTCRVFGVTALVDPLSSL
jgi:hypothetical protein